MSGLGSGFSDRFRRLGDLQDLEASLQKFQAAVELTPEEDPNLPSLMWGLGSGFSDRFRRLGDLQDLEASLQKFQAAVELTPEGHPDLPRLMWGLGSGFRERFQRLGDLQDLEASLQKIEAAVELTPTEHPDLPKLMRNLGSCFSDWFRRLGDLQDLEASLQKLQAAVELTPKEHPDLHKLMRDLGIGFTDRLQRLGDLQDLEASLQKFQHAVELIPQAHPDLPRLMSCLGTGFRERFQRLGDLQDLEASLQKFQAAVELTPEEHPDFPGLMWGLGSGFSDRFRRLGDLQDLETSLRKLQAAVKRTPKEHPDLPRLMRDLGIGFSDRFQRLGDHQDLEASLQKLQAAVELTPEGHTDLPRLMWGLGSGFRERFQRLGDLQDLEAALQNLQAAVELMPEEHPDGPSLLQSVAASFTTRYLRFKDPQDLKNIHSYYNASFKTASSRPESSWNAALRWASFSYEYDLSYCLTAYLAAFSLLPDILWIGHSIPVRHMALHRLQIGHTTSTAFRTCITLSELSSAVELMEQGIATIFQQTLQLKTDVDLLLPDWAADFRRLSDGLHSDSSTDPLKTMNIVNQRNALIAKIRQQPGLKSFLLPKSYTGLRYTSQGGPVIILSSHENGCDGLIIPNPSEEPVHVPFPGVTLDLLKSHQTKLKELIGYHHVRGESISTRLFGQRESSRYNTKEESFADMLTWLWTLVVAPIYEILELRGIHGGRMWWLPTGAFAGLPLHACPQTDQFIHSYTATLGSLLEAYAKKASDTETKLGIVGVTHTGGWGLNHLEGVEKEVEIIYSITKGVAVEYLHGEKATPDAVKQQLQDCSWVHFACHGKQDLTEPTKSHLLLYGGILELQTILRMPASNREFAFLAACQTAMGDSELVNESFHLGGGFIAAGFRSAIGTLWSVDDRDGPRVAEIVYSHLFRNGRRPQVRETAEALHLAVKELKNRKVPYERWVPFIHMGI